MSSQTNLVSSYLVRPRLHIDRAAQWNGFRTQFFEIKRSNPHILRNSLFILIVWVSVIASVQYTTSSPSPQAAIMSLPGAPVANQVKAPAAVAQAATAPAQPAALAGGPTGRLAPAGAPAPVAAPSTILSPFGTYRNNYAWGNCTWYVASRRPVPSNWGNARTWYPRAAAAGWKVGSAPAVGAIAATSAGYFGHVALVEQVSPDGTQVLVSEMNYRGLGIRSSRWAPASSFRYIY